MKANGREAKWSFIRENREKTEDPLEGLRITERPRHHGSSARYIRDPMTQGYRPGGPCRSCGTIPRKSSRSPGPFLVVSHYTLPLLVVSHCTIWTHGHNPSNTSCDPCPPGQLSTGRLPYRWVCTCIAQYKHCSISSATSCHLSCSKYLREFCLVGPSQVSRYAAVGTAAGMDRS